MKEFDPMVFVAVFQEMLGAWLWILRCAKPTMPLNVGQQLKPSAKRESKWKR